MKPLLVEQKLVSLNKKIAVIESVTDILMTVCDIKQAVSQM